MNVPFAPHSPAWTKIDDSGCYGVMDGRQFNAENIEWVDDFIQSVEKSASEFMGKPMDFYNGKWVSDYLCDYVFITYLTEKQPESSTENE